MPQVAVERVQQQYGTRELLMCFAVLWLALFCQRSGSGRPRAGPGRQEQQHVAVVTQNNPSSTLGVAGHCSECFCCFKSKDELNALSTTVAHVTLWSRSAAWRSRRPRRGPSGGQGWCC